ncbi:MAG: hypothetical protein EOP47_26655, partial [Sphingobacteriaceae bacterium]
MRMSEHFYLPVFLSHISIMKKSFVLLLLCLPMIAEAQYVFKSIDVNGSGYESNPYQYDIVGNKMTMGAYIDSTSEALWTSDGTQTGTQKLADLTIDYLSLNRSAIFKNKLWFYAYSPTTGWEPYLSDGTASGTNMLKKTSLSNNGSPFPDHVIFGNNLIFTAYDDNHGTEPWISDGTEVGTRLISDLTPGLAESYPYSYVEMNGKVYFINMMDPLSFPDSANLWVTDGTDTGTHKIIEMKISNGATIGSSLAVYNNKLYFGNTDGLHGNELWVSDGTDTGTKMFYDIFPGSFGSEPQQLKIVNGKLYFYTKHHTLFVTDGTVAGTKDLNTTIGDLNFLNNSSVAYNGLLYFAGASGGTLSVTDGHTVKNIGSNFIMPDRFTLYHGKLYFTAESIGNGRQLFVSDGTDQGTYMLVPDANNIKFNALVYTTYLVVLNDELFFSADYNRIGRELWSLKDIFPVSVADVTNNDAITLYPNPNDGSFKLKIPNSKVKSIEVVNVSGQVVYHTNP